MGLSALTGLPPAPILHAATVSPPLSAVSAGLGALQAPAAACRGGVAAFHLSLLLAFHLVWLGPSCGIVLAISIHCNSSVLWLLLLLPISIGSFIFFFIFARRSERESGGWGVIATHHLSASTLYLHSNHLHFRFLCLVHCQSHSLLHSRCRLHVFVYIRILLSARFSLLYSSLCSLAVIYNFRLFAFASNLFVRSSESATCLPTCCCLGIFYYQLPAASAAATTQPPSHPTNLPGKSESNLAPHSNIFTAFGLQVRIPALIRVEK